MEDLFWPSLGGSNSSVGKVLNLTCNNLRVMSSIPANSKGHAKFQVSCKISRVMSSILHLGVLGGWEGMGV